MTDTKKAAPRQECSPKNTRSKYTTQRAMMITGREFRDGKAHTYLAYDGNSRSLRRFLKKQGASPEIIERELAALKGGAV